MLKHHPRSTIVLIAMISVVFMMATVVFSGKSDEDRMEALQKKFEEVIR
jgi:hypothetical protein